jgi:hypothetical protein
VVNCVCWLTYRPNFMNGRSMNNERFNLFWFRVQFKTVMVCNGVMSVEWQACVLQVWKLHSVTNCTVHRSWSLRLRTWQHARWSCALLSREKKQSVDISGIPVSKGACSVYWSTFDKFLEASFIGLRGHVFPPDSHMRGKRIVALWSVFAFQREGWI